MAKSVPKLPAGLALLLFVFPGDAAAQDLTYPGAANRFMGRTRSMPVLPPRIGTTAMGP